MKQAIDPITYVKERENVIKDIYRLIKMKYSSPEDRGVISLVADWITSLVLASPQEANDFVLGIKGFLTWNNLVGNKCDLEDVVDTLMHDLKSFQNERHQPWFCPRTSGYRKYLTGASGVEA
jgi:hypothetical protein